MSKAVCVTGHRQLFGSYYGPVWDLVERTLVKVIGSAADQGYRVFICGGAVGVDQTFGKSVIKLRNERAEDINIPGPDDLRLVIARPFPTQASKWPEKAKKFFTWLCEKADRVWDVSTGDYTKEKMIKRDHVMVDKSEVVIAVWDGRKSGGTYQTMLYAHSKKKKILVIKVSRENGQPKITTQWYNCEKEVKNEQANGNN